jgi:hypothetical protein
MWLVNSGVDRARGVAVAVAVFEILTSCLSASRDRRVKEHEQEQERNLRVLIRLV